MCPEFILMVMLIPISAITSQLAHLMMHQPLSITHDAPAPEALSLFYQTTLLSMWPPQLASDHQNVNAVVDDLVSYGQQGIVRSGPN